MPAEATLLQRLRALEERINFLERGAAVGITGTDQTIKGSHDRLDAILGAGNSTFSLDADNLEFTGGVLRCSAALAGNGLTGSAGAALAVNVGTGLEISSDAVRIAAAAAGNGLSGGGGSALAVSVDNSTIEINSDALRIKGLTRTFLVQPTRGWVSNDSNPVHARNDAGFVCEDGVLTAIFGAFFVPSDYASGLTVRAVVAASDASGNHYSQNTVFYATENEDPEAANNQAGYTAIATQESYDYVLSVSSSAAAGDICLCRFARAANNASDTATAVELYVAGWLVSYTATR